MNIKKLFQVENIIAGIILFSFLFYLFIAFNNTPAHDDYLFIELLSKYGLFGSIKYWYYSWQGRVSAYFFTNLTLMAERFTNGLFIYVLLVLTLFIAAIYMLMKIAFKNANIGISKRHLFLFSAYFFVFFQEMVYDKSILYWLAASASYYTGLVFFLVGIALLFSELNNLLKYFLLVPCFLITGTSVENLGLSALIILIVLCFVAFFLKKENFLSNYKIGILLSMVACFFGVAVMLLCPGLKHRTTGFVQPGIISAVKIALNSSYHFYKFMLLPELGKLILYAAPFLYFGNVIQERNKQFETKKMKQVLQIVLLFVVCLIGANFFIMAYGTAGMGQPRTLTHPAFLVVLLFSFSAFMFGYTRQVSRQFSLLITYSAMVVFIISIIQNYSRTLPESLKYSQSAKSRINLLLEEKSKGRSEPLILDSLHYNQYVIYRSDEISPDTSGEWNKAVVRALDLDFKISSTAKNYSEEL